MFKIYKKKLIEALMKKSIVVEKKLVDTLMLYCPSTSCSNCIFVTHNITKPGKDCTILKMLIRIIKKEEVKDE